MQNSELQGKMGVRWWKSIGQTGLFSQQTSWLRKNLRYSGIKLTKTHLMPEYQNTKSAKGIFPERRLTKLFNEQGNLSAFVIREFRPLKSGITRIYGKFSQYLTSSKN